MNLDCQIYLCFWKCTNQYKNLQNIHYQLVLTHEMTTNIIMLTGHDKLGANPPISIVKDQSLMNSQFAKKRFFIILIANDFITCPNGTSDQLKLLVWLIFSADTQQADKCYYEVILFFPYCIYLTRLIAIWVLPSYSNCMSVVNFNINKTNNHLPSQNIELWKEHDILSGCCLR